MSLTVGEIIGQLPRDEYIIVKRLRLLVTESLPHVKEKLNYGVPFYTRHRRICFIWPPSIHWGPKKKDYISKGVVLGFCYGNLLNDDEGVLIAENRKQVYYLYFKSPDEIDDQQIKSLLFEADRVDEEFGLKKKLKKKV